MSGMRGPAGSLSFRQHSSRGHRGTQASPPQQVSGQEEETVTLQQKHYFEAEIFGENSESVAKSTENSKTAVSEQSFERLLAKFKRTKMEQLAEEKFCIS